jgi:exopolyphosphatase/guanosine-5'-triphosphate,3'-diphosphate pyrophosphatase
MESFRVGSVAWSMRYFPDGVFTTQAFETAEVAAKAVLDEALNTYRPDTWEVAYGASGTVGAVGDILVEAGWPEGLITRDGLDWLLERLLKAQSADKVRLEGMKEDRRAVIGGGVSVLRAVFDLLSISEMHVAQGALRHGALYDLLDREQEQTDQRHASVTRLASKFSVDQTQAQRVSKAARHLFRQVAGEFTAGEMERLRKLWAARCRSVPDLAIPQAWRLHPDNADAAASPELHWPACWCWDTAASCASWRWTSKMTSSSGSCWSCAWPCCCAMHAVIPICRACCCSSMRPTA